MRTLVLALFAVCLALGVSACADAGARSAGPAPSVPVEAEPPATSPADTTQGPTETEPVAPPEASPAETRTFEVWFVRDAGSIVGSDGKKVALGPRLFSTSRTREELASMARAAGVSADVIHYGLHPLWNGIEEILFEALRAGPSPDEAAAGVTSAIPADAKRLVNVIVQDGTAFDLPSEFESGGNSLSMRLRLAQVVFTMSQLPRVNQWIRFSIDGQPVNVLSRDGRVLDRLVSREDFADLLPPSSPGASRP